MERCRDNYTRTIHSLEQYVSPSGLGAPMMVDDGAVDGSGVPHLFQSLVRHTKQAVSQLLKFLVLSDQTLENVRNTTALNCKPPHFDNSRPSGKVYVLYFVLEEVPDWLITIHVTK